MGTWCDGSTGDAGALSEKKRVGATALASGSCGWAGESLDSERVAAPKAAAATPIPKTLIHKAIKNISMAKPSSAFSLRTCYASADLALSPFPIAAWEESQREGLTQWQIGPANSSVVDGGPRVCHYPAILVAAL